MHSKGKLRETDLAVAILVHFLNERMYLPHRQIQAQHLHSTLQLGRCEISALGERLKEILRIRVGVTISDAIVLHRLAQDMKNPFFPFQIIRLQP